MMQHYFKSYFNTAIQLIHSYDGMTPLNIFLKNYFSQHKKHGSKDRKWIAHFCYCYYRLGFALKEINKEDRLQIAIFLCTAKNGNWLSFYEQEWQAAWDEDVYKRIQFIQTKHQFVFADIFYNNDWLSKDIDAVAFNVSHLIQPDLFIRIRPRNTSIVINKLHQHNISFKQMSETCLAFDNATKIENIIYINKEAVVQDISSQQIASLFLSISLPQRFSAWDCCAASGGKSILLYDSFNDIKLTVSDIRNSILHNLQKRFAEAGIKNYQSFIADVSSPQFSSKQQYDLVICDVPCSGSGTWSRTPEQLPFFNKNKLSHYTELQKQITFNAIKAVKPNGYFLYITCSVFMQENEEMVEQILQHSKLKLVEEKMLKGYNAKADTMFAALFVNL
ncbi:MAG: methyltransferase domain-containing protein [Bacteroidota bacterium]|nr:methyltransferase domain-containing protein [Bacteroidota bacterium]